MSGCIVHEFALYGNRRLFDKSHAIDTTYGGKKEMTNLATLLLIISES